MKVLGLQPNEEECSFCDHDKKEVNIGMGTVWILYGAKPTLLETVLVPNWFSNRCFKHEKIHNFFPQKHLPVMIQRDVRATLIHQVAEFKSFAVKYNRTFTSPWLQHFD